MSNSSSSSSADSDRQQRGTEFRELETARRRKELKERHNLPTKSILKKHWDSEDSRVTHTNVLMTYSANELLLTGIPLL